MRMFVYQASKWHVLEVTAMSSNQPVDQQVNIETD